MPGPAAGGELPLSRVVELAAELDKGGAAKANNAVRLVSVLSDSKDADVLRAAIQGLKLFFVDASQGGDLGSAPKRQKVEGADAGAGPSDQPEDVYRQWLRRQYDAYVAALLALLHRQAVKPATQIVAVGALMEAVRCEQGVGVFAGKLYCQLLAALVTSTAVQPEVLTFLFTRYFQYTDVRYFTHWAVREIAAERAEKLPRPGGAAAEGAGAEDQQPSTSAGGQGGATKAAKGGKAVAKSGAKGKAAAPAAAAAAAAAEKGKAGAAGTSAAAAGAAVGGALLEDVSRMLFDVLVNIPEGMGTAGEEGDAVTLSTWCGMEQAGTVLPTSDPNQSAKQRRKRRAQDVEEAGLEGGKVTTAVWASPKAHRRAFSEAWLALLQLPIPADILRKVLVRLHSAVLPNMTNPLLLSDFLTFSLNQGGIIGMLALNAIFMLVTQYGLEYPRFYERLYQLITPQAFAAKYRAQFFRLADLFLASGLVPAYTVAAFAKKMARLGLSAPPSGALAAIAFIHNLVRRHPACMVLLHNPSAAAAATAATAAATAAGSSAPDAAVAATASGGVAAVASTGQDVFDLYEPDPAKSRAVESSLWELGFFRNHYCPQVAGLCQILDKDLTDRTKTSEVDVEPLLDTSYTSLFVSEAERRLKQVPLAFYIRPPTKLFDATSKEDFGSWAL